MKNQPNKVTVKDGLPTAHNVLSDAYQRHGWMYQPTSVVSGACPHDKIALSAMQSYSDQQNAELRERVKELEAVIRRSRNQLSKLLSDEDLTDEALRDYSEELLPNIHDELNCVIYKEALKK